jgi:exopolysaccharide production protein ExoZ
VLRPQQPTPGKLTRAFAFLGDASYSLYLTHYLVLPIPRRILSRFIEIPYMPWTLAILLLVFAVVAAICMHLLFERPLTRMLYRWIGGLRARPGSADLLPRATSPQ